MLSSDPSFILYSDPQLVCYSGQLTNHAIPPPKKSDSQVPIGWLQSIGPHETGKIEKGSYLATG